PWTAPLAFLTGFGTAIFGGIVIAIVGASMGASLEDPPPGVTLAGTGFQNVALIGAALIFACLAGRPSADDFGLRRPRIWRSIGRMILVCLGFYAFAFFWSLALSLDEAQTLPDELGIEGSTLNLVLVVILITVVAPIGEEMFFRGYFFAALRNWHGWLPAAIITGIVFGAIHIGSAPIGYTVPLAVFGFGLCVLYQRTGSLYPCIALHALNNSLALGLTQDWTWQIAPLMAGATIAALTLAWLLGRMLGSRVPSALVPAH
ncbi:MAG: CPBP family intramembrane metalloprotease, partial [Solirubrobacterales bacterium]|nr:CPBP family intramembrane metalloprotease [Solirubrobacterales bacterium]